MAEASLQDLHDTYHLLFFDLVQKARDTYLQNWDEHEVQLCKLLSIKTGGCSEDCKYCAQSSHYQTGLEREKLMNADEIVPVAREARENGATRFCMGAAWKGISHTHPKFPEIVDTVRQVAALNMEVCVTLGSLTPEAAHQLKEAGLTAYNHNIDTSPEYYPEIVSTHTFDDRMKTIKHVQEAGISVCCGGIIGMGEEVRDRLRMLQVLTGMDPQPESVPINCLMAMDGTPLEDCKENTIEPFQLVRLIATTRVFLPKAKVRLSAGRSALSREAQALCFFAGANSIFFGDKLLTAGNPGEEEDLALLRELGYEPQAPQCEKEPATP